MSTVVEEKIKITDRLNFHYEVMLKHTPNGGYSTAYYYGQIIAQVELGKIHEPMGDNDNEWECYEERFSEWQDEIKINIIPACQEYFNKKLNKKQCQQ